MNEDVLTSFIIKVLHFPIEEQEKAGPHVNLLSFCTNLINVSNVVEIGINDVLNV